MWGTREAGSSMLHWTMHDARIWFNGKQKDGNGECEMQDAGIWFDGMHSGGMGKCNMP